jgi:hypothetical protein
MNRQRAVKFIPLAVMVAFLSFGCAKETPKQPTAVKPVAVQEQKKEAAVYKGKIVGKSNKAKTISISVGKGDKAKTKMVRFDDNTKGIQYAQKGAAAIINWEQRGTDQYATTIKPKLAKLPKGVTEIKTDELFDLLESGTALTLVDARPDSRYHQAHIPGSLNVPVPKLKKMKAAVLPKDKDKLLIFYCGGPT